MSISSLDPVVKTGKSPREEPPRLIRLLSLTVGFTVLALFCMVWNAVTSIQQVEHLERRYQRIELVQGTIVYLDEVLTMSTRMAAATGGSQWEARYRKFEPELTDAIQEALTLSSECGAKEVVKRTEAANSALIEMENRAFDLVHHGRLDAARAIVVSEEYDRQKESFSAGITEFNAVLNRSVPQIVKNVHRGVTFDLIISAFILSLLISCLIVGRRTTDRWKATLFRKTAELAELNVSLDRRINEQMSDLRGSEEQFRQLAENIQEAFWMTDPELTSMLYISPAYERIWGRTCESLIATPRSFLDAVLSEDREAIGDKMIMTMKLGQPFTSEYRILRPDGEMCWIRDRGFPIRNAQGEVYRYAGIAADVTERNRVNEALAESERFVRSTLDALSTHIAILDEKGIILATNKAWRDFAEANAANSDVGVGASYLDACDSATGPCGEEAAATAAGIRAVIRGEQTDFALEYPCHSPSDRRWFVVRATRFGGDGPLRVVMSHENITAAKLADEEREKFVALVENSTDFVGMATTDGEVIYTNPAACELVEFDPRVRGVTTRIAEYYTEDGNRILDDKVLPALKTAGRWEGEIQFRNFRTGQPIDTDSSVFLVRHPKSGEPLCMATVTRDITKRKSAEENLRQANAAAEAANQAQQEQFLELEHLYRTAPVGLELLDRDYRVIRVNELLADINGVSVDEHIGRTLREIIPQFAPQVEALVDQVFATGEPVSNVEVRGITQADPTTERDWIVGYYPVKGQDGVPRYVGCVVLEITERKKVEDELRRNKDLLQNVIDNIPCAVFWKDRQSVNLGGNQLAATDLGFASPAEMIGKNNFDLPIPREEAESFTRFDREVMESGKSLLHFEEVVTKPDGSQLNVLTSKVPLRGVAGEIFGVLAIYLDISDRKRAEQQLANHVDLLQEQAELLDLSHDAITVRGLDGTFSFWSKGAEELYGWTSAEALGAVSHNLLQTRFPKPLAEINADLLRTGRWEGTLVHTCKDGTVIVAASRWTVKTDGPDKSTTVLEINSDITAESKAQEAQLRSKEAAEAANRAKSEFLANMSHEIRTPMNGILGMTELTLDSNLTGEQRENLGMVKASADSLLQVINDILDFSKIEAGKLELDPTPFSLRDSLGATANALGQRAFEKGLELICHVGPTVPDELVGDSLRLRQVVTNLVGNAIKFTDRGEVVVQVNVEGTSAETVCLHFTVRDTGIGIPTEKQRVIFGAFTQADASTTRSFGGTGLGLAIASQLVALMGGRIWVESEVDAGSTFHFTIQLKKQSGTSLKPLTGCVDLAQLPVLIVDDNATNRAMLEETLTNWRMCPVAVSDGISAIAAMKQSVAAANPFPLVLLDAFMPEMDGFAVVEQIKRDPNLAKATIMMLSSADRSGDAARCRKLGVACYLRKPIAPSDLFDAIQVALGAVPSEKKPTYSAAMDGAAFAQRSLHILLAEDNEVNQELAVKLLQKHGHTVAIAADGRQALAALERESVDVILMDIQMPVMDGFATTAAIRDREKVIGGHTPIIALTAHAMKGDQERCLAAGMDAYVSKPLRLGELFEAIARVVPIVCERPAIPASIAASATNALPTEAVFDAVCALASVEGDAELLMEIISLFVAQSRDLLPEIRSAGERHDGKALEQSAHKLKGSIQNFGDVRASAAALHLETMGHTGEFVETEKALADLEQEVASLRDALQTFTEERAACKS